MLAICAWDVRAWECVLGASGCLDAQDSCQLFSQVKCTNCLHTLPLPPQSGLKRSISEKPVRLNWEIKLIRPVWIIFILTMVIESDLCLFYLQALNVSIDF